MICDDLLYIEKLKGLKLIAGKNGLHRTIRWIYFADTQESMDYGYHLSDWVHGGELIVITSKRILSDTANLISIIKDVNEKDIAGVIINIGYITDDLIKLANKLELPLFELPWSIKSVDLSQIICKALVEEENFENTLDRILGNILFCNEEVSDDLVYQALYYGFDLRRKCRIAVFDINDFSKYIKDMHITNEGEINSIKTSLQKLIKNAFRRNGIKKIMTYIQSDSIVILFPTGILNDEEIISTIKEVSSNFIGLFPNLTFSVGIGNCYDKINMLKRSFEEAVKTIDIAVSINKEGNVWFYKNMGFYSLLFYVQDEIALRTYYKSILEDLDNYDEMKSTQLLETLNVYIHCNCSISQASENLFIHRNTLRYRLDRIEEILDIDLSNIEDISKISLAFAVREYLKKVYDKK